MHKQVEVSQMLLADRKMISNNIYYNELVGSWYISILFCI